MFSDYESAAMRQGKADTEKIDKKKIYRAWLHHTRKYGQLQEHPAWYIHTVSSGFKSCSQLLKFPFSAIQRAYSSLCYPGFVLGLATALSLATYPFPCSAGGIMG